MRGREHAQLSFQSHVCRLMCFQGIFTVLVRVWLQFLEIWGPHFLAAATLKPPVIPNEAELGPTGSEKHRTHCEFAFPICWTLYRQLPSVPPPHTHTLTRTFFLHVCVCVCSRRRRRQQAPPPPRSATIKHSLSVYLFLNLCSSLTRRELKAPSGSTKFLYRFFKLSRGWIKMSSSGSSEAESKMQKAAKMKDEDKMFTYKGVLYPTVMCTKETFERLDSIQAREDDVMLVAYPKCGESRDLWPLVLTQLSSMKTNVKKNKRFFECANTEFNL